MPLSSLEGYVLSLIDGGASISDLSSISGLEQEQLIDILRRLVALGAARIRGDAPKARDAHASAPAKEGPARSAMNAGTPHHEARRGPPDHHRRSIWSSLPPSRPMMSEASVSQPPPDFRRRGGAGSSRPGPSPSRLGATRPGAKAESAPPTGPHKPPSDRVPSALSRPPLDPLRGRRKADYAPPLPREEEPLEPPLANVTVSSLPPAGTTQAIPPGPPSQPDPLSELAGSHRYSASELIEEVDLPMQRRKQVLDFYYRLEDLDHYELLGVPCDADKQLIRKAYFRLSKLFHPDSMFRKQLGSFKAKMETVFQHLTDAYETLGRPAKREAYDRYLLATKSTRLAERAMRDEVRGSDRSFVHPFHEDLLEPSPFPSGRTSAPSTPPPSHAPSSAPLRTPTVPPAPQREVSEEARRLARQVIERRLRGVLPKKPSASNPPPRPSQPPPSTGHTDPHELIRRLAKTLKEVSKLTGTHDPLTRHVKASQAAFSRGNLEEATFQMRRALSIAPDRPDLQFEHDRLSKLLSSKLAEAYETQATFEQQAGKWASASLAWSKVCEGQPESRDAHFHAAFCMLKAGADLRGAQRYAQRAVQLAPGDIDAHVLLAQVYLTIGLRLNAKRELDAALKLDPENEMVKNLLGEADG